uniref:Protein BEAN1 n=1 Tax=Strigops habroptila TaxID=2489341 RepID=A0A672UA55_STRHB
MSYENPVPHLITTSEFPNYSDHGNETHVFFSPILVAGVVIGIVLFLSCITIIVGGLRKERRLRRRRPRTDVVYDGFSYGGSFGELRATCIEEYPPTLELGSSVDTRQRVVNVIYSDAPPRYDECVGPGARQMYIPTDNPPPYSVTDPCRRNETSINIGLEAACGSTYHCRACCKASSEETTVLQLCAGLGAACPSEGLASAKGRAMSGIPEDALC